MENYHILYDKYMYYIVCQLVFESGKKSSLAIVSGGVF